VDPELQVAFDSLRDHVDRRFDHVDRRFEQVDERFEQVDRRFEQVDRGLSGLDEGAAGTNRRLDRLEEAFVGLRRHVDETATETRRHFDVVAEGLRSDIRLLAEGFTWIDRRETTLREEIVRSNDTLAALIRASYTDLDRRVTALERRPGNPG
jgi:hypothetical protein